MVDEKGKKKKAGLYPDVKARYRSVGLSLWDCAKVVAGDRRSIGSLQFSSKKQGAVGDKPEDYIKTEVRVFPDMLSALGCMVEKIGEVYPNLIDKDIGSNEHFVFELKK